MSQTAIPYVATNTKLAYWCPVRESYILDNYEDMPTLPLVGWIKSCNVCLLVSKNHVKYTYKGCPVDIPLCKRCVKHYTEKDMMEYICDDICSKVRFTAIDDTLCLSFLQKKEMM